MLEILILAAAVFILHRQLVAMALGSSTATGLVPAQVSPQLSRLVEYANRLYAERKWLAAEKAYLNVLKQDHNNLTAYSHLGIIYSTQKNLPDAIECFEIAARLKPGAGSYQNLGLAYYENHNYMKAVAALEKANMFEPSASRYVGLAKAYSRLKDHDRMIASYERATQLDPSERFQKLLREAYREAGRTAPVAAAE